MSMMDAFSSTYKEARAKFLAAAYNAGGNCVEYVEPGKGVHGEPLAMDVVRVGPVDSQHMLMITSGCHGVEGYAGSAAQIMALRDSALIKRLQTKRVALLLVHALNPYGFSYSRRVTAEHVDLNRNIVDFSRALPANADYRDMHPLLLPEMWPPAPDNLRAIELAIKNHGFRRFQEMVTGGQYEFPDGLFYGGNAPTWSHLTFLAVLRRVPLSVRKAAWIDLHTGLGACGVGERIFTGGGSSDAESVARQWWGEITQTENETAVSTKLTGQLGGLVRGELAERLVTSITLEFGTTAPVEVLHALRADAWAYRAETDAKQWRTQAAIAMKDAFLIDSPVWKEGVIEQSMATIEAAVKGLENYPTAA
ncbi:MAG: DUF2817 domain-containing protein [Burkholderiaceae bacterium]|nr:DUF2817 domain-containing protein [Burkholderiaceae bacterium]